MAHLHRVTVVQGKLASWVLPSSVHRPGTWRPRHVQAARRLASVTSPMKPPLFAEILARLPCCPPGAGLTDCRSRGLLSACQCCGCGGQTAGQQASSGQREPEDRPPPWLVALPLSPRAGPHSWLFGLHVCTVCGQPLGTPTRSCSQACPSSSTACHVP